MGGSDHMPPTGEVKAKETTHALCPRYHSAGKSLRLGYNFVRRFGLGKGPGTTSLEALADRRLTV